MDLLAALLIDEAWRTFSEQLPRGVFPEQLVDEMHGIVAGCHYAQTNSPVTIQHLVAVNYGFDWVSALAFSGKPRM